MGMQALKQRGIQLLRVRRARLIREARGISLDDLHSHTNLKAARVSRFERCERTMAYEALRTLADYYDVPIDVLLEEVLIDGDGQLLEPEKVVAG